MKRNDPKVLLRDVEAAVSKMRKADDDAAELRDEFHRTLRKAHGKVKLDDLAKVSGLTAQRVWQICQEDT